MVLGGYSQGAAVAGYATAASVPDSIPGEYRSYVPNPMPPQVSDHVAAVVLFGEPSDEFMRDIGAPPIVIGSRYADKLINLCAAGDTVCDGTPVGAPSPAHTTYFLNGMTGSAAAFVVSHL